MNKKDIGLDDSGVIIRAGGREDILAYLAVCQRASEKAYRHPDIDSHCLFAVEHYFYPTTLAHWQASLMGPESNWWVAHPKGDGQSIIGGIQLIKAARLEGAGFYVDPLWQGRGVGRALWQQRQKYIDGPLFFEVFSHASQTIAGHEKHGAQATGAKRLVHWDSWPAGVNLVALEYVTR